MSKKRNDFFWLSYSDLMTSLFFVMLVLFVLVFTIMKHQQGIIIDELAEYRKIEEIKQAINSLDPKYFEYDSLNKRHELKVNILFTSGRYEIPDNIKPELYKAGLELSKVINKVAEYDNIKYLIIIEGMAARYNNPSERWKNSDPNFIEHTYILSFNRAKALFRFWQSRGIPFDENVLEIVIAGSGWFGAGRYTGSEEGKNKRFLIQIIPKVGMINYGDEK